MRLNGDIRIDGTPHGFKYLNRNVIINGNFDIWQLSGVVAWSGSGESFIGADRWKFSTASASFSGEIRKSTDVPDKRSNYSLEIYVSNIDASGNQTIIFQKIEGFISKRFGFGSVDINHIALSFWVKSSLTGTYCVSITNSATDYSCVKEYTINQANKWEKKSLIIARSKFGTWEKGSGTGLIVRWAVSDSAGNQTNPDSWVNGDKTSTPSQVNLLASSGNTFKLSQVQLEDGDEVTPFEDRYISTELELCQRYFYRAVNGTGSIGVGYCANAFWFFPTLYFPTEMRAIPSLSYSNISHFQIAYRATTISMSGMILYLPTPSQTSFWVTASSSVLTVGDAAMLQTASSSAIMDFSAEL